METCISFTRLWWVVVLGFFWTTFDGRVDAVSYGHCKRTPNSVTAGQLSGDNGYSIRISGNPDMYAPGEKYTVTLAGFRSERYTQKFIEFMLVVEPLETRNDILGRQDVGTFQLYGDSSIMFSETCPNALVQTSAIQKSEIQVMWRAPSVGSGCVVFKATVVEDRNRWYMDEGNLVKVLCEQVQENEDEQPEIIDECCACDEAKYEFAFEGVWSRHTHPKDFPEDLWNTYFTDILGASHSGDFRMWEYGGYASDGVRQISEQESTKKLETEMKEESTKIRTIIKARGLRYPSFNAKTYAVFRVDKDHHLMSFLTTLVPSPDWIVGVSALELCLKNCSWITEKVMNLYPWDAGIDNGVTYKAPRSATMPQETIHRITASNPNTDASPFYDPTGTPMKPVARMTVTRQRLYEKSCDESGSSTVLPSDYSDDYDRPECSVTQWSEFTPCSVTCGQGLKRRTRRYYNPQKAEMMGCQTLRVDKQVCHVDCPGIENCRTTPWGSWSECSVTCGNGLRTRSRKYLDPKSRKICTTELMEKEMCVGRELQCDAPESIEPNCAVTHWSEWSPCTATCGKGMKVRTRLYLSPASMSMCSVELMQKEACIADRPDCLLNPSEMKENCLQPQEVGPCRGYYLRWFYDSNKGMCSQFVYGGCRGNKNNFPSYSECSKMCNDLSKGVRHLQPDDLSPITTLTSLLSSADLTREQPIDCQVTGWSEWSDCSTTCGNGRKERRRMIKINPDNGGKPCPRKLVQRRKCKDNPPCYDRRLDQNDERRSDESADCVLNPWSEWSPCSKTCGFGAMQKRERSVRRSTYGSVLCRPTTEKKYCNLPPCPFYDGHTI